MTNLDSILKSRDITLSTKVHLVKAMVFPVVMDGCENWSVKKAVHQRIDASELWCWKRLLRVPWTARRSNQSILKEINPEYSPENESEASILPSITVFSNESALHIRGPNYYSFSISSSNEYSGLVSFWIVLLANQGTLKSLCQHHSSKASILQCSAFFMVQLPHLYILEKS